MGDELYKAILERVRLVPNVHIRKDYFIPTETKLDLPDIVGNTTYSGYDVHCSTAAEVIVGFDTRTERIKKFGFLSWGKREEPLARLDDIREELARVPEIGEPLSYNERFLVYEKNVGRRVSLKLFDLVVVGVGSFLGQHCEAIQQFDNGRFGAYEWLKIDVPFAAQLKRAHVASYGR
ncbi:hypothetical protein HYT52_04185 [Candidatus Woesearchaeota archaeon]|nr:hypothetical protein [Candidatus Woesearchaeota archaeon]